MFIQYLIVTLLILFAALYAGKNLLRSGRAFKPKKSCGNDCGCGNKT